MADTKTPPLAAPDEAGRLRAGIREVLADLLGAPCSFWACPGPDHPAVPMATCNVCGPQLDLRALLGDPPPVCTVPECDTCGRESPWCEACDWKLVYCEHAESPAEVTS